jgi:tungstate transport system substrate-binding protein
MSTDRRRFLAGAAGLAGVAALPACKNREAPPILTPHDASLIRISSVPTAVEGNLLPALVAAFEKTCSPSMHVELVTNPGLYDAARAGKVDLAISHYGHRDAEQFVVDGFGEWPRTIFSNQMALVGPPSDPAGIRGMTDVAQAFARIAATKQPFVMNELDGIRYLVEILWHAAGAPERTGWLHDHDKEDALRETARRGGYTFWGLTPFLRTRRNESLALEPLVLADPMLQRMLVSIVVRPEAVGGVNADGARAFQQFLLEPSTQALIRATRYSDDEPAVYWVPGGRHNRTAVLPSV